MRHVLCVALIPTLPRKEREDPGELLLSPLGKGWVRGQRRGKAWLALTPTLYQRERGKYKLLTGARP